MLKAFIASLPLLLALAPAVAQDRPEQSLPAPMAGSAEALPSKETGYIESSMDAQG